MTELDIGTRLRQLGAVPDDIHYIGLVFDDFSKALSDRGSCKVSLQDVELMSTYAVLIIICEGPSPNIGAAYVVLQGEHLRVAGTSVKIHWEERRCTFKVNLKLADIGKSTAVVPAYSDTRSHLSRKRRERVSPRSSAAPPPPSSSLMPPSQPPPSSDKKKTYIPSALESLVKSKRRRG